MQPLRALSCVSLHPLTHTQWKEPDALQAYITFAKLCRTNISSAYTSLLEVLHGPQRSFATGSR